MTGEEAKRKLREQGITLKEWADARGYPYTLSHASFVERSKAILAFHTKSRSNWA